MDEERHKAPGKRELTYRVGWRKGRLEIGEDGQVTGSKSAIVFMEQKRWRHMLESYVWRKAPIVPASGLTVMLYALPVVMFGLTWWLVYMLSSVS